MICFIVPIHQADDQLILPLSASTTTLAAFVSAISALVEGKSPAASAVTPDRSTASSSTSGPSEPSRSPSLSSTSHLPSQIPPSPLTGKPDIPAMRSVSIFETLNESMEDEPNPLATVGTVLPTLSDPRICNKLVSFHRRRRLSSTTGYWRRSR
jgi:hypothetical protein